MQPTIPATDPGTDDLRTLLGREHELLNATWCAECFSELEQRLQAHMALEEEQIFPGLERVDATEANALRAQHASIRSQLAALAVAVDLHTAQAGPIRDLVRTLREHASREDALAYRWADANIDPRSGASLRTRVRERIASLAERARTRWSVPKVA